MFYLEVECELSFTEKTFFLDFVVKKWILTTFKK